MIFIFSDLYFCFQKSGITNYVSVLGLLYELTNFHFIVRGLQNVLFESLILRVHIRNFGVIETWNWRILEFLINELRVCLFYDGMVKNYFNFDSPIYILWHFSFVSKSIERLPDRKLFAFERRLIDSREQPSNVHLQGRYSAWKILCIFKGILLVESAWKDLSYEKFCWPLFNFRINRIGSKSS